MSHARSGLQVTVIVADPALPAPHDTDRDPRDQSDVHSIRGL